MYFIWSNIGIFVYFESPNRTQQSTCDYEENLYEKEKTKKKHA